MISKAKADTLGILSSSLCLVHCLATPVLFVARTVVGASADATPHWWHLIDFVFLAVSLVAIYFATKSSCMAWLSRSLWGSWMLLAALLLNESLGALPIPEWTLYVPALSIVFLHSYNLLHHRKTETACCSPTLKSQLR